MPGHTSTDSLLSEIRLAAGVVRAAVPYADAQQLARLVLELDALLQDGEPIPEDWCDEE